MGIKIGDSSIRRIRRDPMHVATALELSADYMYTFDQQQRRLAQSIRLKLN